MDFFLKTLSVTSCLPIFWNADLVSARPMSSYVGMTLLLSCFSICCPM
jgi:hypothetical protein